MTWTYDNEFSFLFLNLSKILKNSTPGKVAAFNMLSRSKYMWLSLKEHKFFFLAMFLKTAVIAVVA